jgi:hypothetical protein
LEHGELVAQDQVLSVSLDEDVGVTRLRVLETVEGPARGVGRGLRARVDGVVLCVSP